MTYRMPHAVKAEITDLAGQLCGARLDGYETEVTCTREADHPGRHNMHDRISWPAE